MFGSRDEELAEGVRIVDITTEGRSQWSAPAAA